MIFKKFQKWQNWKLQKFCTCRQQKFRLQNLYHYTCFLYYAFDVILHITYWYLYICILSWKCFLQKEYVNKCRGWHLLLFLVCIITETIKFLYYDLGGKHFRNTYDETFAIQEWCSHMYASCKFHPYLILVLNRVRFQLIKSSWGLKIIKNTLVALLYFAWSP